MKTLPPEKPLVVLESRRPADLQRLGRLLAELAWKRALAVQSQVSETTDKAA